MTNEELFFEALKSYRESKDIEISEICEFTKINSKYIEAIESGDFQVLPTVYMRLFLRAYSDFIGADSAKALENFELHTIGKIQKRTDFDIKPTEDTDNLGDLKETMESTAQISPKQVATGVAVLICLFLILYWAGEITSQQSDEVEKASAPIEEMEPAVIPPQEPESIPTKNTEDGSTGKKSPAIDNLSGSDAKQLGNTQTQPVHTVTTTIPELVEENTAILPNKLPLNTNDFLPDNRDHETTNIVKLFKPYTITIMTLVETKLNISKSNEGELTELINQVVFAGEKFQFDFESTINFEFWNNAHIKVKLNEITLDTFLSDDGFSIRGSYEADKSQLYLGFYRN